MNSALPTHLPAPHIHISYEPPSHGWLAMAIVVNHQAIDIDASGVPNNPIEELLSALDLASEGIASRVWWHMEPHGYFMHFTPDARLGAAGNVEFRLVYAPHSDATRGTDVVGTIGSAAQILLPFWRFVREFQSQRFQEPHWPETDYSRILTVKDKITLAGGAHQP